MNPLSGDVTLATAATSRVIQISDTHLMGGRLIGVFYPGIENTLVS